MNNILLFSPLFGNGGIASWTKKFINTFNDDNFKIIPVSNVRQSKDPNASKIKRVWVGAKEIFNLRKELVKTVSDNKIDVFHTTTSGSIGTVRDLMAARICNSRNIPCVMHCRYGCIPQTLESGGLYAKFLVAVMSLYSQIWVLDRYTYDALKKIPKLAPKVRLTPNSIEVPENIDIKDKDFKNFAFIANIIPTKGIFELIEATRKSNKDFVLHIVGPSTQEILSEVEKASGDLWGKKIKYHGSMPNKEAVNFLKDMDALVLPTYYPGEAFPISILEAMSLGKLVISTPRAAIKDMLTTEDGEECGILVSEKSSDDIVKAFDWIHANKDAANALCRKAYNKVYNSYRTSVVYDIYRNNYLEMLNNH